MSCTTKQAGYFNVFIVVFKNKPLKNVNTISKHNGNKSKR